MNQPGGQSNDRTVFAAVITGLLGIVAGAIGAVIIVQSTMDGRRADELQKSITAYRQMGDAPRIVRAYIHTGNGNQQVQVRAIARHFRELTTDVASNAIDGAHAGVRYGGVLLGWSRDFGLLARGESPAAQRFSADEREQFAALAAGLQSISASIPADWQVPDDDIATVWEISNAVENGNAQ